ncbi:MAG: ROK family protein [Bacteroidia bacterium]|jgi:glucokinase|nr:ROK family protein [Bacteroidia bacterium]
MKLKQVCAGIDIGGTNCHIGICSIEGTVLASTVMPTAMFPDAKAFAKAASQWLKETAMRERLEIVTAGIGAPNGNYYTGNIEYAPNLEWKGIVPLAEEFKSASGIDEAVITNDANAAAIGEQYYGGAKGLDNFAVITLGTGVGGGFIVNGKMFYGADGMAGEFGHMTVVNEGRLCGCGRKGCVEAYASASGLIRTAQELLEKPEAENSALKKINPAQLTCPDIFEAARYGDDTACAAIDQTAIYLAEALVNMTALLSPSHIFLYGGLARAGDVLMVPLKYHFKQRMLKHHRGRIELGVSLLPENAAIIGAAALGWSEFGKHEFVED